MKTAARIQRLKEEANKLLESYEGWRVVVDRPQYEGHWQSYRAYVPKADGNPGTLANHSTEEGAWRMAVAAIEAHGAPALRRMAGFR